MNEKLKEFLALTTKDEALAAKIQAAKSADEAYAIASAAVKGFTKDEFVACMTSLTNKDLSAEDLAGLAGGVDSATLSEVVSVVTSVTAPAVAGI